MSPQPSRSSRGEPIDVPAAARENDETLRQRVLVLPFLDEKPDRPKIITEKARQVFIDNLNHTHRFVLIAPQDLQQDASGMRSSDGGYDLEAIAKLAAPLGATVVIEGRLLDVQVRKNSDAVGLFRQVKAKIIATARLHMVAVRNGKDVVNQVRTAEVEDSTTRVGNDQSGRGLDEDPRLVQQAVEDAFLSGLTFITQSLEKMTWEGRIAMIAGDRVYLNAGRLSGLQINDILKVTEEGKEIYDPQTGRFIGKAPGRMKGTVEVVSYFGKDGAIAVIHSGSGFKENDRVEMY